MTVTLTNPDSKQEPLWFRIGRHRPVTDEFKDSHRMACIGRGEIMYSDDLSDQVMAKKLCASCPCFKACALWALLSDYADTDFAIIAGMDPNQRRRIRDGREHFWDWRRDFNYAQRAARAAKRKREHRGIRKSDLRRSELPLCKLCGSEYVQRSGVSRLSKQRYRCTTCHRYFMGEVL